MPTFGSLFAGIGGIDLGLERAGWTGRWQVEWDEYCQHVLAHHWPDIPRYGDITTVDWSTVEPVDLLAGGFPCQPVSAAGKRKAQSDARWLWPEFLRAIRALRPRYVLVENVTNLLAINGGTAFGEVIGGLAESGYDAEWDCIPAAAVGALHERDRVWIVAYANRDGRHAHGERSRRGGAWSLADSERRGLPQPWAEGDGGASSQGSASPADAEGRGSPVPDSRRGDGEGVEPSRDDTEDGQESSQRPLGLFRGGWGDRAWSPEPDVGRVAHGVPSRVDRLRALGNAVVPQVVEVIGRQLLRAIEDVA